MDRFRRRSKKEKPQKHAEREKSPMFITDVKTIKENLKIKEILRTVKMNSSMRIKAPKGSKVMQNKDFNDNEDPFEVDKNVEHDMVETTSATNPDVVVNCDIDVTDKATESCDNIDTNDESIENTVSKNNTSIRTTVNESTSMPEGITDPLLTSDKTEPNISNIPDVKIDSPPPAQSPKVKMRDRKLSLDQTMLSRREGFSQSEMDLNSIGKSPLERKSSFFRKKMDSFLRNTTEIFKRQTSKNQSIQRRGSMSVSLQSLNENNVYNGDFGGELLHNHQEELQGSNASLHSSLAAAQSNSSLSMCPSERTPDVLSETDSLAGSRPVLTNSQPLEVMTSDSIHSLNEAYLQESLLYSRAISMSSGLDTAHGQNRRKNRSNRVTWLASEGLTNYLRRIIQDEKSSEIQSSHSYQDFSTAPPNNQYCSKMDSKGRRLSYQRAVSGEDPRYHDSTLRKRNQIQENSEACQELAACLAVFQAEGVPALRGYDAKKIDERALAYLHWAMKPENLEEYFNWKSLPEQEISRQTMIRELITTEADYIRNLTAIAEVFIATAHALQDKGMMLDIDTPRLFTNIADVLDASLSFWALAMFPMLHHAVSNVVPFDTEMMVPGFEVFYTTFHPYEKYMISQNKSLDYLRSLNNHAVFKTYLTWCHSQKECKRLQLSDIMVKPMQRLTKYSLIIQRIGVNTSSISERESLRMMELRSKAFVTHINRAVRQVEEEEKIMNFLHALEVYEPDVKDEELQNHFQAYNRINMDKNMPFCLEDFKRTLIYETDMRYKDFVKEFEARVILLTDMLLVSKKSTRAGYKYRLARPKYFVGKMKVFPRFVRNGKDLIGLSVIIFDDLGSSHSAFTLMEINRETNPVKTLELKIREAMHTYSIAKWYTDHPSREFHELDLDLAMEHPPGFPSPAPKTKEYEPDDYYVDKLAKERFAFMTHNISFAFTASTECEYSMTTESFEVIDATSFATSAGRGYTRPPIKRHSTGGSSRNSRFSSFQQSTSGPSHDDAHYAPQRHHYRPGSSVEHNIITPHNQEGITTITVNVVTEEESEPVVQKQPLPTVVLQHPSPLRTLHMPVQSQSPGASRNSLQVQQPRNVVMALVHSLPDLTLDPALSQHRPQQSLEPLTASEKLYQSHQELLQRNRLNALQQQHYLSPDLRGTSYPPPSPTRASLRRGLAFSYSLKNPRLTKISHMSSQSQQPEPGPSTSLLVPKVNIVRSGSLSPVHGAHTSTDSKPFKSDKKSKPVRSNSFFSSGGWYSKMEG